MGLNSTFQKIDLDCDGILLMVIALNLKCLYNLLVTPYACSQ